jgi:hypothetical protein
MSINTTMQGFIHATAYILAREIYRLVILAFLESVLGWKVKISIEVPRTQERRGGREQDRSKSPRQRKWKKRLLGRR